MSGLIPSCGMMIVENRKNPSFRTVQSVIFGHNQLLKNILHVHILYGSWLSGCDVLELQRYKCSIAKSNSFASQGHRFGLIRREHLL